MTPGGPVRGRGRGQGGFALLIVLWTVSLLAVLAAQLTASGRGETQLARNIRDAAVTEAAADGAVREALLHALDSSAAHWRADTVPHLIRHPAGISEVRIYNEAGKLDLNSAQPELLAALLRAVGADARTAATVAAAIVDWRFADAQRPGGDKVAAYRAAGRSLGPPGAPFQSLEELGLVLGMTPDLLARLLPHLTLAHEGPPDFAAAGPVVRQALREAMGGAEPGGAPGSSAPAQAGPPEESAITIIARTEGPGGARFVRRAVVKLGAGAGGSLFQVLGWDSLP